jgi:serine protease DegS
MTARPKKAGLKAEDILVKWNDKPITGIREFVDMVRAAKPGTEVKIVVQRDSEEKTIKVTIGKAPPAFKKDK